MPTPVKSTLVRAFVITVSDSKGAAALNLGVVAAAVDDTKGLVPTGEPAFVGAFGKKALQQTLAPGMYVEGDLLRYADDRRVLTNVSIIKGRKAEDDKPVQPRLL